MLNIILPETDAFPSVELSLEHSLLSLSKWESIHEEPFFDQKEMTPEKTMSYFECMLVSDPPHSKWIERVPTDEFHRMAEYINSNQTATWFRETKQTRPPQEKTTSELIYYWLVQFNIPFWPTETWHLNRLMTLVKIAGIKQSKPEKMSPAARREEQRRLNEERRKQMGTSG